MGKTGSPAGHKKGRTGIGWIMGLIVVITTIVFPVPGFAEDRVLSEPLDSFSQPLDSFSLNGPESPGFSDGAVEIVVDVDSDPNAVNLNAKTVLDWGIVQGYLQLRGNGTDEITACFRITYNGLPLVAKRSMSFFLELQSRKSGIFGFRKEGYKPQYTYTEQEITASAKVSETKMWRAYVYIRSPYTIPYAWNLYTPGWTYNKKAQKYPSVKSPVTNRRLPQPNTEWKKDSTPVPWNSTIREAYRRKYEERHPIILRYPNTSIYWEKLDAHHIRPRKYGGTNKYSNLIPIYRDPSHKALNRWFANY